MDFAEQGLRLSSIIKVTEYSFSMRGHTMSFLFSLHYLHDTLISFTFICWHGLPYILNSVQLSVTLPMPVTTDRASVKPKWTGKKMFCWRNTLGFSDEVFCKRLIAISLPLNEMLSSFHGLWGGESVKEGDRKCKQNHLLSSSSNLERPFPTQNFL